MLKAGKWGRTSCRILGAGNWLIPFPPHPHPPPTLSIPPHRLRLGCHPCQWSHSLRFSQQLRACRDRLQCATYRVSLLHVTVTDLLSVNLSFPHSPCCFSGRPSRWRRWRFSYSLLDGCAEFSWFSPCVPLDWPFVVSSPVLFCARSGVIRCVTVWVQDRLDLSTVLSEQIVCYIHL